MENTYYEILGVSVSASEAEIKESYRRLAREYHPDLSDDPQAEAKMKQINEAYEVLSDRDRREAYDTLLRNRPTGSAKAGTVADPIIGVKPSKLDFGTIKDGEQARLSFIITNTGGPLLNDPSFEWKRGYEFITLEVEAQAGADPFPIRGKVEIDTAQCNKGKYSDVLVFEADGLRSEIRIEFTVNRVQRVQPNPASTAANPATVSVTTASYSITPAVKRVLAALAVLMLILVLAAVKHDADTNCNIKSTSQPNMSRNPSDFRVGDVVKITSYFTHCVPITDNPRLDTFPGSPGIDDGEYVTIIDGPYVDAYGAMPRWKIRSANGHTGWIMAMWLAPNR